MCLTPGSWTDGLKAASSRNCTALTRTRTSQSLRCVVRLKGCLHYFFSWNTSDFVAELIQTVTKKCDTCWISLPTCRAMPDCSRAHFRNPFRFWTHAMQKGKTSCRREGG